MDILDVGTQGLRVGSFARVMSVVVRSTLMSLCYVTGSPILFLSLDVAWKLETPSSKST